MPNFHNIEKLPTKSYYTGYAEGAIYRIYSVDGAKRWRAHTVSGTGDLNTPHHFYERTLKDVSAMLDRIAEARRPLVPHA